MSASRLSSFRASIDSSLQPEEAARDCLAELKPSDFSTALAVAQIPFEDILAGIDPMTVEELFRFAISASGFEDESPNWIAVFNDFRALVLLMREVREDERTNEFAPATAPGRKAAEYADRLSAAFFVLRKTPKITERELRDLFEVTFEIAVGTLSEATREKLFGYVNDRMSESGAAAELELYTDLASFVQLVKPDVKHIATIREQGAFRRKLEAFSEKLVGASEEELEGLLEIDLDELEEGAVEAELTARGLR